MPLDRQGISSRAWSGSPPPRPGSTLCRPSGRTRWPTTVAVTASSLDPLLLMGPAVAQAPGVATETLLAGVLGMRRL
ncbi:MAG: hypothetical protein RLZZ117_648 [Cyanobacteriota bacterium]|jgi:hypothetical protein